MSHTIDGPFAPSMAYVPLATQEGDGHAADQGFLASKFPGVPTDLAASFWAWFVAYAEACLQDYKYNGRNKNNFVYRLYSHSPENTSVHLQKLDLVNYYHLNFYASDEAGRRELFFGEIRRQAVP